MDLKSKKMKSMESRILIQHSTQKYKIHINN